MPTLSHFPRLASLLTAVLLLCTACNRVPAADQALSEGDVQKIEDCAAGEGQGSAREASQGIGFLPLRRIPPHGRHRLGQQGV